MGHLQKVTKAAAGNILEEIDRDELSRDFDPAKHNIDRSRTRLNYDLTGRTCTARDYINQRLSEIKVMNRSDVKVLGQWVWTMPKDLDPKYEHAFFEGIYEFYCMKHGRENVAYARVHKDESSPHAHFGIIPVVKDKNGNEKCCAKDVFTKAYMNRAHSELQQFLTKRLGVEVNLINGQSLGVEGVENFKKAKDLVQTVAALEQQVSDLSRERSELTRQVSSLKQEKNAIQEEIKEKRGILETIRDFLTGHPNFFDMFLHWLHPDLSKEERHRYEKKFEQHTEALERQSRWYNGLER